MFFPNYLIDCIFVFIFQMNEGLIINFYLHLIISAPFIKVYFYEFSREYTKIKVKTDKMIQYSFSPNWYRPNCLAFSHLSDVFFYCSNCIVYAYNLTEKRIINELNLKKFLIKEEGYSFGLHEQHHQSKNITQGKKANGFTVNKQVRKQIDNKSTSSKEKEKNLKINTIQLFETNSLRLLIVGFNCIGIILLIEFTTKNTFQVKKVVDLPFFKKSQSDEVETIFCFNRPQGIAEEKSSLSLEANYITSITVISSNSYKLNFDIISNQTNTSSQTCYQVTQAKQNLISELHNKRNFVLKHISKQKYNLQNLHLEAVQTKQLPEQVYLVFLGTAFPINHQLSDSNVLVFDQHFGGLITAFNLQKMLNFENSVVSITNKKLQQKNVSMPLKILSLDSIRTDNQQIKKYAVLNGGGLSRQNLFSEKFELVCFDSNIFKPIFQKEENSTNYKKASKATIQLNYPKKCHHKLTNNKRSTVCIKFITQSIVLLTGRLGQMILINLRQIELQLQKNNDNQMILLSIRPYSHEQIPSPYWVLLSNQKHYKDVYGIYRVNDFSKTEKQLQNKNVLKGSNIKIKGDFTSTQIHLIGTDHTLTTWTVSGDLNCKFQQNIIKYESSIKFLTSSVEQIFFSELQPSLIFLRLKDSNIRSFQPFSQHKHWLNEYWKHTTNNFSSQIQKVVMHPKQIGVCAMVSKEGKIILYDLYEERLIKVFEISEVVKGTNKGPQIKNSKNLEKPISCELKGKDNSSTKEKINWRLIQINAITFEHQSVIKGINLINITEQVQNQEYERQKLELKQKFKLSTQSFYERQLDRSIVLLLQTNDNVIIFSLESQKRQSRFYIWKKVFKLQRIYKTKYWNSQLMIGTRKKKGDLIAKFYLSKHSCGQGYVLNQKEQGQCYQLSVKIPFEGSRYIFKLNELYETQTESKEQKLCQVLRKRYILTVVYYKTIKISISMYQIKTQKVSLNSKRMSTQEQNFSKLQVIKIFESKQFQIPNVKSTSSNSSVNIEHLILSQQPEDFLIGIYNNQAEIISIVDYNKIFESVTQKSLQQQNLQEMNQQQQRQANIKSDSLKRQFSAEQFLKKGYQKNQRQYTMSLHQFTDISYKIQSMIFNRVNFKNGFDENFIDRKSQPESYLIILGKDQSVRILNLIIQQNTFQNECKDTSSLSLKTQQFVCFTKKIPIVANNNQQNMQFGKNQAKLTNPKITN